MKRGLYLLIGFALGFGALVPSASADAISSSNFNDKKQWGMKPEYSLTEQGAYHYWYYTGSAEEGNESLICNYATNSQGVVTEDRYNTSGMDNRPEYITDTANNTGKLRVYAAEPLLRTFNSVEQGGLRSEMGVSVPSTGLYIDYLFKADIGMTILPTPEQCMARGTKIGFGIRQDPESIHNFEFVVVAGCVNGGRLTGTNFVCTASVSTGRWYRVTARMFANASTDASVQLPGFALYLNGVLLRSREDDYDAIGEDAKKYLDGNEFFTQKALFPSMQKGGGRLLADQGYALGFTGNGHIDEFGVTQSNIFAQAAFEISTVVKCDDKALESLEYSAKTNGYEYAKGSLSGAISGSKIATKPGATITLTPKLSKAYVLGEKLEVSGNLDALKTTEIFETGGSFELNFTEGNYFKDSASVIASVPTTAGNFKVGDVPYALFADAVAAAAKLDGKVAVETDVMLDGENERWDQNGQARVLPSQKVTLDLKGHKIKGDHFDNEAAIYNQGSLAIVDSVGGGMIEAAGTVIASDYTEVSTNLAAEVNRASATLALGSETSKDFKVIGRVKRTNGKLVIMTGSYLTPKDESDETFYLAEYVDTGRFSITRGEPQFWTVARNDLLSVHYATSNGKGTVTPTRESVAPGEIAHEPKLEAPGYRMLGWFNGEEAYDFNTPVTSDLHLTAKLELETYEVTNDWKTLVEEVDFPTNYTVESAYTPLPDPYRMNFKFAGWFQKGTELQVEAIGEGAKFVGTDLIVTGKLDLVAAWVSEPFVWRNTDLGLEEGNGTYEGVWRLRLPSTSKLPTDTKMKINEIDLAIVNPTQYGRTSPYLAIKNEEGQIYVSKLREDFDPGPGGEYVGYEKLSNGRAKIAYVFEGGVPTKMNADNEVYFCSDAGGTLGGGFLRLIRPITAAQRVIDCCDPKSAPDVKYAEWCPAYEIKGEAVP